MHKIFRWREEGMGENSQDVLIATRSVDLNKRFNTRFREEARSTAVNHHVWMEPPCLEEPWLLPHD